MRPIVNMPEEDRATDTGNVHKNNGKDRACGSGDILADRDTQIHTDRQTHKQTYSSQYLVTAPAGEVNIDRIHPASCTPGRLILDDPSFFAQVVGTKHRTQPNLSHGLTKSQPTQTNRLMD